MSEQELTRRDFLKGAAGAAIAMGLPTVMATPRALGANDRIHLGLIGCGGMGFGHLQDFVKMGKDGTENVEMIAVSDIFQPRMDSGCKTCGGQAFHDYRKLLELKDLDGVVIATPDHWHSRMTIDAMEAGLDVYCEKPMTLYWEQAKEVYQAAQRTGRVVQVGSQGTQDPRWLQANELIRKGALGKLLWSQTSISRNSRDGEWNYYGIDHNAGPHNLDWKAFLGPAPQRPYDPERFFRWRKYWDYSGGIATDLFTHVLHALELALGPEFPKRVVAGGGIYVHKDREVPDTFHAIIDYPSEHSVVVVSSMENEQGVPVVIRGHEATMYLSGGDIKISPERLFADEREEMSVPVPGVAVGDHYQHRMNFLQCMRTREKPRCNVELGYKVTTAIALAVRSYRENKAMCFDPVKQELIA